LRTTTARHVIENKYAVKVYLFKEKLGGKKEIRAFGVGRAKDGRNQKFNKHWLEMPNPDTSEMQS